VGTAHPAARGQNEPLDDKLPDINQMVLL